MKKNGHFAFGRTYEQKTELVLQLPLLSVLSLFLCQAEMPVHSSQHKPKSTRKIVKEINKTTKEILQTDQEILSTVQQIEACSCSCQDVVIFSADDINVTGGYVITLPGKYKLCGDVNWAVTTPNSYAITISGENVSLDLGGNTMVQLDPTQATNFAIQVTGTADEVTISNGTLQDFTGGGIIVQAGASCVTISGMDFNTTSYNGQTTLGGSNGAWASAILLNGSPTDLVENVTIRNCQFCDLGIFGGPFPEFFQGSITGQTLNLIPTATFTASMAPGPIATMNVTAVSSGRLFVGQPIVGTGVLPGTVITSYIGPNGGSGSYLGGPGIYGISLEQAVSSEAMSAGPYEPINVGEVLSGTGVTAGTTITGIINPLSYIVSVSQSVGLEIMEVSDPNTIYVPEGLISAILSSYAQNVTLNNINVQDAFGAGHMFAINAYTSTNLFYSDISVQGLRTFGLNKGFYFNQCQDAVVVDSNISNLVMYATTTGNVPFNAGGNGSEGIKIAGSTNIALYKSAFYDIYLKSQVPVTLPATVVGGRPYFFSAKGVTTALGTSQIIVEDCSFYDIFSDNGLVTGNNGGAAGYGLFDGFDMHCTRCSATNISSSFGDAYGFNEETFVNMGTTGATYLNNTFTNCTVNFVNITDSGRVAAGFRLVGTHDQVIGCDVDLVQDLTGVTNNAYGIILDTFASLPGTVTATNCDIKNNTVTNCTTGGIWDNTTTATTKNIISGNYASFNGSGATANFKNFAAWIPVRNWHVGTSLPAQFNNSAAWMDPTLDNLNIWH